MVFSIFLIEICKKKSSMILCMNEFHELFFYNEIKKCHQTFRKSSEDHLDYPSCSISLYITFFKFGKLLIKQLKFISVFYNFVLVCVVIYHMNVNITVCLSIRRSKVQSINCFFHHLFYPFRSANSFYLYIIECS